MFGKRNIFKDSLWYPEYILLVGIRLDDPVSRDVQKDNKGSERVLLTPYVHIHIYRRKDIEIEIEIERKG